MNDGCGNSDGLLCQIPNGWQRQESFGLGRQYEDQEGLIEPARTSPGDSRFGISFRLALRTLVIRSFIV